MRVAYILLAHKEPDQLVRLVRRLDDPSSSFFVHIDRYADDAIFDAAHGPLAGSPNVRFLPRRRCSWGGFGMVDAALEGLAAVGADGHDFAVLLSGQDYPLRRPDEIHEFLGARRGTSFFEHFAVPSDRWLNGGLERFTRWYWHGRVFGRSLILPDGVHVKRSWKRQLPSGLQPYGGSMYWAMSSACVAFVNDFVERNRRVVRFFRHVNVPDESFFHTIVMNSPLAPTVVDDDLHYTDWSEGTSHPKTLTLRDVDAAFASGKLFARKFADPTVLDAVDARL